MAAGLSIFAPLKLQGSFLYVLYLILVSAKNRYKLFKYNSYKYVRDSFFIFNNLIFQFFDFHFSICIFR